jgi:outer membrane lipoprotein-sorting protein
MSNEHCPVDFEDIEPPLAAAVKVALAEPIPEDAVERVKARAKQLATTAASPPRLSASRKRGWKASRSLIAGLSAAAALVAALTGSLLLFNYAGGRAFAQVVERVKAASSVRFTTASQLGKGPEITGMMYLEGSRMRFEQFDGMLVGIGDFERKQALALDTHRKLAQSVEIDARMARAYVNPIDQLQRAKSNDAEQIGEDILKGRRTRVYRVRKADLLGIRGRGEMMVWVDAESGLPAKIVIRDTDPKAPMEFRFDEFVWNEPLDARLFSLAIPDGFQTGVVVTVPDPPKPTRAETTLAANPNYLADGILSRDLVPAKIIWGLDGKTITALMRHREGVPTPKLLPNELRQWDVATRKLRWKTGGFPRELAGTADGKTLATVIGWEVQLRDAASGKITRKWATDEYLSAMDFAPDGKTLAAGIAEWGKYGGRGGNEWGGVQLWDVERANLVRSIKTDDKPVLFVKYSVDGKFLATSSGLTVKLWNAATGELVRMFPGMYRADVSPDGQSIACQVASSPANGTVGRVDLYNLQDGSIVKSFASDKGPSGSSLCCVAFSPDGRLLAAADWNGIVTVWDVATGQPKLTITDHTAGVLSVAFAPDGAMLATGSEDQTLRLRKLPAELIEPAAENK